MSLVFARAFKRRPYGGVVPILEFQTSVKLLPTIESGMATKERPTKMKRLTSALPKLVVGEKSP